MKTFFDRAAYAFTGALFVALLWFLSAAYGWAFEVKQEAYTQKDRDFLTALIAKENSRDKSTLAFLKVGQVDSDK